MAWFKVDDGFWSHPKTATLSDAAVTLWVRSGAYSCQHLTDGVIKTTVLRLVGDVSAAAELVAAGLWIDEGDGWRFHDWDEYQETSETVKKRRADARDRQRRAREARENKRSMSQGESRVTGGVSNAVSSLPPTRPDPTRPDHPSESKDSSGESTGDESPPSPFCKRHQASEGSDYPCRGCKLAAQKYDEHMAALAPPDEPYVHQHRWFPDGSCVGCDERREAA